MARARVQPVYITVPSTTKQITSAANIILPPADQLTPLPVAPNGDYWYSATSESYVNANTGSSFGILIIARGEGSYTIIYEKITVSANVQIYMPSGYTDMRVCILGNTPSTVQFLSANGPEFGVYVYTQPVSISASGRIQSTDADVVLYDVAGFTFRGF